MNQILDGKFDPITHSWGFWETDLRAVATALLKWRQDIFRSVGSRTIAQPLHEALRNLEPLTGLPRRELLLSTDSNWTAFFDNSVGGGDPTPPVSHLARVLHCRGLAVTCIPNTLSNRDGRAKGTYGAVQFQMFAPEQREFLNIERAISAANDGGRWVFSVSGIQQPFEKPERYNARRIQDRFTADMLSEYCSSLGIRVFDPQFYGPNGVIVEIKDALPDAGVGLSLKDTRRELGII